jgi:hypothetical protein
MPEFLTNPDEIDIRGLSAEQPDNEPHRFDAFKKFTPEVWNSLRDKMMQNVNNLTHPSEMYAFFRTASILAHLQPPGVVGGEKPFVVPESAWENLVYYFKNQPAWDNTNEKHELRKTMAALHQIASTFPEHYDQFKQLTRSNLFEYYMETMAEKLESGKMTVYHHMAYHLKLTDASISIEMNQEMLDKLLKEINSQYRNNAGMLISTGNMNAFTSACVAAKTLYPHSFSDQYITDRNWEELETSLDFHLRYISITEYPELLYDMYLLAQRRLQVVGHRAVPVETKPQTESGLRPLPDTRIF